MTDEICMADGRWMGPLGSQSGFDENLFVKVD